MSNFMSPTGLVGVAKYAGDLPCASKSAVFLFKGMACPIDGQECHEIFIEL